MDVIAVWDSIPTFCSGSPYIYSVSRALPICNSPRFGHVKKVFKESRKVFYKIVG